jgi:4-aminobutyrate aminotransferase
VGYVPPTPGFLAAVQALGREHGILLIADEVQSGFGRTGRWFAHQHDGVEPDIMIMAKGIASGMPLSGIAAREALMAKWIPGTHGGTYGGNAVSCAAATATIRVIRDENLVENSARRGAQLLSRLRELQGRFPVIGDVRGVGLMIGVEFTTADGEPDKGTAKAVWQACVDRGLLLLTCGTYGNVIRWIPPLIIDDSHIEEAVSIFGDALAAQAQ